MLNLIFWLVFGFLVGWIGAILAVANSTRTAPIVIGGTAGGVIGGASMQALTANGLPGDYNPTSLIGATILAIVMVAIIATLTSEPTSS